MLTTGRLLIHSAPASLCPHVEWAVSRAFDAAKKLVWEPQPAAPGSYRCELLWMGDENQANRLVQAFRGWDHLRYEVVLDADDSGLGLRYSFTPALGLFRAVTGVTGDIYLHEDQVKDALRSTGVQEKLWQLLGTPWDRELDPYRAMVHPGELRDVG